MIVSIVVFAFIAIIGCCLAYYYGLILIERIWHSEWLRKNEVRVEESIIRCENSLHEYENLLHEYEVKYSMNKNKD